MAQETKKYDEDYLNGLIAKAKKSWEGVDVDSYMNNLRDDSFDKEVAEKLSKKVTSYITEQIKSNIDAVTIKCRDLMYGDWCCDKHGFQWQIIGVGDDYAYATFEGNEGDPWEFDDKDDQPEPIPITSEILEKNGWIQCKYETCKSLYEYKGLHLRHTMIKRSNGRWVANVDGIVEKFPDEYTHSSLRINVFYVHELQHALRLCGLNELADNFKI